jgi:hypothetical protein
MPASLRSNAIILSQRNGGIATENQIDLDQKSPTGIGQGPIALGSSVRIRARRVWRGSPARAGSFLQHGASLVASLTMDRIDMMVDGKARAPPSRQCLQDGKLPTAKMIAEGLSVPERVMLFCVPFARDWHRAAVDPSLARQLFVRGLIDRQGVGSYTLTDQGRAVLAALRATVDR